MKYLAILLLAVALPNLAFATDYVVQPASSTLQFIGTFQGAPFTGHFSQWSATIRYDPTQLANSKFDVSVTPASARTEDADQQKALPGTDFFNVAKFPIAHFSSTGFRQSGAQVIADGNLTLRGMTKPISLNVIFKPTASGATLDVSGVLNRLNFGVGSGDYADTSVIGANVKVTAHLQLVKK